MSIFAYFGPFSDPFSSFSPVNTPCLNYLGRTSIFHQMTIEYFYWSNYRKGVEYAQQNRVLNSDEDTYDWFRSPHSQSLAEPYGFCLEHKLPSTSPLKSGYEPITCCNFQQQLMLQEFAAQQQGNVSSTHRQVILILFSANSNFKTSHSNG